MEAGPGGTGRPRVSISPFCHSLSLALLRNGVLRASDLDYCLAYWQWGVPAPGVSNSAFDDGRIGHKLLISEARIKV